LTKGTPVRASIRSLAAVAVLACLAASAAASGPGTVPRGPRPDLALPESGASGQRAIDLLGEQLPAVAASYGMTPQAFRQILLSDRTARIDRRGHLYYVDELQAPLPPTSPASGSAPDTAPRVSGARK
jgi:hypothetical protein